MSCAVTVIAFDTELDPVCSQHLHRITGGGWEAEIVIPEEQGAFGEDSSVDWGFLKTLAETRDARCGNTVEMITYAGDRGVQRIGASLSEAILDPVLTAGILPFDGPVNAGDHTRTAFKASGEFDHHLPLLIEGIEVSRAGVDAESLFAIFANGLIENDMSFFVVLKGINSQFFCNFHGTPRKFMPSTFF